MSDRWAVDIVEALKKKEVEQERSRNLLFFGKIKTAKPLVLEIYNQEVTKNIYVNPALILEADDNIDKIDLAFKDNPSSGKWFELLDQFHKAFIIKKGDEVIVMQSGDSFYVVSKAVVI